MQLLIKPTSLGLSILLVCSSTMAYFQSQNHRESPVKRVHSNSIPSKRGKLFFKSEALPPVTLANSQESLALECEAGGSPQPTMHWLKDGERVEQGNVNDIFDDEAEYEDKVGRAGEKLLRLGATKSKLFLDCPSKNAQGSYSCVAETPYHRISTSTDLRLNNIRSLLAGNLENQQCLVKRSLKGEPARIYLWTANRIEMEGADVQLFCRAEGYPKPVITWVDRDGNLVQRGDHRFKVLSNGDLLIRNIGWKTNLGVYNCIATNPTGTDRIETFLYPTTP